MENKTFPEVSGAAASSKPSWWRRLLSRLTIRKPVQSVNQHPVTGGQVTPTHNGAEFVRR